MVARFVDLVSGLMPEFHTALGQTVAVPVNDGTGVVAEEFDEVLVDVTCGVLRRHRHVIPFVNLCAPFLLIARVDGTEVITDAGPGDKAVNADYLGAFFSSGAHGKHAARAAAHDNDVGRVGGLDLVFGDFGFFAEPVAVVFFRFRLNDFNRDFAFGLGNTLGGGFTYRGRGDACARDGIKLRALAREKELFDGACGRLTDRGRFIGNV